MRLVHLVPALFVVATVTALRAAPEETTPPAETAPPKASLLSREEMKVRAKGFEGQVADDYRHVISLRDRAKKKQDVVKLNCVNDKLVQLKPQMNITQTSNDRLLAALDATTDADRGPAFDSLSDAATNVHKLREEANTCMGEDELYKQEAGVEVDHPEIVDDPTTFDPYDPGVVSVDPPGYASPFE